MSHVYIDELYWAGLCVLDLGSVAMISRHFRIATRHVCLTLHWRLASLEA
jgi:hypothetical protein